VTTVRSGALIRVICVTIAAAIPAARGLAAPTATASVDRTRVSQNETITLTVSVAGADNVSDPDVSELRDFDILGSFRSRSMSISGAGRVSEMVYSYTLRPRQTGELTIPSLDVPADRTNLRTDAITISVVPTRGGTARPGGPAGSFPDDTDVDESEAAPGFDANSDVVIKCETDKQRAYVGEQILLTFSLYSATALNSADYEPANTEGFRTQALPPPDRHYEVINGRRFVVQEELKLLFPTARGEHVIGPAKLNFATRYWDPAPNVLQTEPITIEVLRVPEAGRPESFTGVVGELNVDTLLDRDQLKQGEAATLTVVVSGWGNLEAMEAPTIALPPGLREYQSSESREFAPQVADDGYRVQGEAVFDSVIIPTTVGDVQIPEVEVAYFSPVTERYETARSLPAVLHVEPGDAGALEIETPGMAGVKLKPLPDRLRGRPRDRVFSAPFMAAIVAAALWLLATVIVHRRRKALAAIKLAAPGGGFELAIGGETYIMVQPDAMRELVELVQERGRYPIDISDEEV